jgi:hypothetical protein
MDTKRKSSSSDKYKMRHNYEDNELAFWGKENALSVLCDDIKDTANKKIRAVCNYHFGASGHGRAFEKKYPNTEERKKVMKRGALMWKDIDSTLKENHKKTRKGGKISRRKLKTRKSKKSRKTRKTRR